MQPISRRDPGLLGVMGKVGGARDFLSQPII